jgi:hypothetical protein
MRSGFLSVSQNGRTLSRLPLPPDDKPGIVIPLAGMQLSGDWASITMTVVAQPVQDDYCWDPTAPIRLVNSSMTFTGNQAPPTTVADFLPPALRRLTIAIPAKPSEAESNAAVQLAAAMATRYGWQDTDIAVVPLPDGGGTLPDSAGWERQIVLKEGPDKGVSLQPKPGLPALFISGPGDELTNQTRLLTDASLPFALSSKVVPDELTVDQKPALDTTTLTELKQTPPDAESLQPEVSVKVDQTRWAQSHSGIRVHLIGSYTPMPSNFNGELIAEIDKEVIDRWPFNPDGTIDRWVNIPNRLVQRSTELKVREHITGDPGHCNDFLNPELRIDGSTEIQVNRASPPIPPGFRSLPQALGLTVQIGIGDDRLADTVRAAKIIVGLQRNSTIPLVTKVTNLKDAINSKESAILISADGWTDQSLTLPFTADLGHITIDGLYESGEPTTLVLDPGIKSGSLQTLFDGQRSVLVATSNGAPAQLDELLRWLSVDRDRWSSLDGRAIISVPFNAPVIVPNRRIDLPTDDTDDTGKSAKLGQGWAWWVAGGIAGVALLGAIGILFRMRKPLAAADAHGKHASDEPAELPPQES